MKNYVLSESEFLNKEKETLTEIKNILYKYSENSIRLSVLEYELQESLGSWFNSISKGVKNATKWAGAAADDAVSNVIDAANMSRNAFTNRKFNDVKDKKLNLGDRAAILGRTTIASYIGINTNKYISDIITSWHNFKHKYLGAKYYDLTPPVFIETYKFVSELKAKYPKVSTTKLIYLATLMSNNIPRKLLEAFQNFSFNMQSEIWILKTYVKDTDNIRKHSENDIKKIIRVVDKIEKYVIEIRLEINRHYLFRVKEINRAIDSHFANVKNISDNLLEKISLYKKNKDRKILLEIYNVLHNFISTFEELKEDIATGVSILFDDISGFNPSINKFVNAKIDKLFLDKEGKFVNFLKVLEFDIKNPITIESLKKAYKNVSIKWHPDKFVNEKDPEKLKLAEDMMILVNLAKEILIDNVKNLREQYLAYYEEVNKVTLNIKIDKFSDKNKEFRNRLNDLRKNTSFNPDKSSFEDAISKASDFFKNLFKKGKNGEVETKSDNNSNKNSPTKMLQLEAIEDLGTKYKADEKTKNKEKIAKIISTTMTILTPLVYSPAILGVPPKIISRTVGYVKSRMRYNYLLKKLKEKDLSDEQKRNIEEQLKKSSEVLKTKLAQIEREKEEMIKKSERLKKKYAGDPAKLKEVLTKYQQKKKRNLDKLERQVEKMTMTKTKK